MFFYAGRYNEVFLAPSGTPLPGASVTVHLVGTSTLATLYTSRTKTTPAANPFTTDSVGNGNFFADPGDYDLAFAGQTRTVTVFDDPGEITEITATVVALGNLGSSSTLSLTNGSYLVGTLNAASCAIAMPTVPNDGREYSFTLELIQDTVGGRLATWGSNIQWANGSTPPVLTSTAGRADFLFFSTRDGGTTWRGFLTGANFGPFSPLDLAPVLWLKADGAAWTDTGRTIAAAANQVVLTWDDLSGNGNHMVTAVSGPTLKTGILNAKPVMRFDGSVYLRGGAAGFGNTRPLTCFVVCSFNNFTNWGAPVGNYGGSGGFEFRPDKTGQANPGKMQLLAQGTTLLGTASSALTATQFYNLAVTYDALGNYALYKSGGADGVGVNNAGFTGGNITLSIGAAGGTDLMLGDIAEVIKFHRVLSAAEMTAMNTYLTGRYGAV